MSKSGTVFAVKRLEIHDGPGVRTTVFLKGCPLRCLWCHNPEGLTAGAVLSHYSHKCTSCGSCLRVCPTGAHRLEGGQHVFKRDLCISCGACEAVCPSEANHLFGRQVTASELLPELLLDKPFFDETGGGVTVSGGEPLGQTEFLCELLMLLREKGIHTAVDTSLAVPESNLLKVSRLADLFLCDIKAADPDLHERLTGRRNERILSNLRFLRDRGTPVEIRVPYVPGQNDGEIPGIAGILSELPNVTRVKVLSYHDLARTKYDALGLSYPIPDTPIPDAGRIAEAQAVLDEAVRRAKS